MRASVGMRRTPDPPTGILQIRLLGELEVLRGGTRLALPASRRTRALLGYLVASAAPQLRSALCDLLWDGPEDPRASLRWSLTKLRPLVDDGALVRLAADRERVGFDPLQCAVDVVQVRALLGPTPARLDDLPLPALEQAAALLRGEFLDGLDLPACYRFHHWCMAERERYGAWRQAVLQALTTRLAGDPERALPYGRAMVAADPLSEAAHAALVRLLAAADRYPDAERHYEWARELLRREIALPAGGALDQAVQRARHDRRDAQQQPSAAAAGGPDASTAAATPAATAPAASAPLVGRADACAAMARTLAAGAAAPLLLFTGEPGIGKTRLLERFAADAAALGRRVVRGRCFEAEMVRPYGLWLDTLRGLAGPSEHAAPLLDGSAAAASGGRGQLFDAAAALLRELAARQALALVLDDLQWIDEGSAALLHFLARTLHAEPGIVFAAAARAGEIDDNPWARGLLHSLAREGGLQRLALTPLGLDEARTLLGTAGVDAADAWRRSGGNPLYLVELAQAAGRAGAPAEQDTPPASLQALIDDRVQALDESSRELLSWAAATGRELQPELLAQAAGWPVAEVLARLERLERRGLLVAAGAGRLDFGHDLVRQALYRSLSQPRRRTIHRQFLRALAAGGDGDAALQGEIIHHAELAGEAPTAVRACLAAGAHCLRVFANEQAGAVAERGLARLDSLPPGAERTTLEIDLLRLRVGAAAGTGGRRLPALASRIEQAIAAAQALGLHAQAAAGWEILAYCQQASDSPRTQQATLAAQRSTRHADAATHCRQLANSGRCLLDIEADPAAGRALLAEAAALADQLGLQVMELDWGRGLAARADGDLEAAIDALANAVVQARLAQNHWREYECMVALATVELEAGRHAHVLRDVEQIAAAAARMGEAEVPFAQALAALACWREGDAGAERRLADGIAGLRALDDKAHLAYALNEAAAQALEDGRLPLAAAQAAEALAAAQAVRRPTEVTVAAALLARAAQQAARRAEALVQAQAALRAAATPSARAAAAVALAAQEAPAPLVLSNSPTGDVPWPASS